VELKESLEGKPMMKKKMAGEDDPMCREEW